MDSEAIYINISLTLIALINKMGKCVDWGGPWLYIIGD